MYVCNIVSVAYAYHTLNLTLNSTHPEKTLIFTTSKHDTFAWHQITTIFLQVIALLSIAQCLCWYGLITRNNMGHVIEESLWAFTFAMVGVALGVCAPHLNGIWREISYLGVVLCVAYVYFMVTVDVPMYYKRWRANNTHGTHKHLGLKEGFHDALTRRVVTLDWELWRPEVAWLSGYFTGAVLVSIGMAHLPRVWETVTKGVGVCEGVGVVPCWQIPTTTTSVNIVFLDKIFWDTVSLNQNLVTDLLISWLAEVYRAFKYRSK